MRSLSTLFGTAIARWPAAPSAAAQAPSGGSGESDGSGAAARPTPDGAWADVVARSVELGYRVIDDYVRQGERVARGMSPGGATPDAVLGSTQEVAGRMAQYATDLASLWLQVWQAAGVAPAAWSTVPFAGFPISPAASGAFGVPFPWGALFGAPPYPAAAATRAAPEPPRSEPAGAREAARPTRVAVSVSSPYPVQVTLDLRPDAGARRIVAQALRSPDGEKPRLSDVAVVAGGPDEPLTLRIRVPLGQPAGIYNGIVIEEESGLPVGTVSLRVDAA
jgi:hypothetical protein